MADSGYRQRCLLTGASGYIGSRLAARLVAECWEVHVALRPDSRLGSLAQLGGALVEHRFDGTTQGMIELVARAAPDTVFHLASLFLAQHRSEDIGALIDSNVRFSTQLLEAMAVNRVRRFVNTGTAWQHYRDQDYLPVNLYAATKQAFEAILDYYVDAHGFAAATLALFDTYGPGDPRPKLIPLLWKAARSQQLLEMSPGEQLIDLVHVDDVVDAIMLAQQELAAGPPAHARYGVSSGRPLPLRELVAAFERATGTSLPIAWGGRPYRSREVMQPWTRYTPVPGWAPTRSFEKHVAATAPA